MIQIDPNRQLFHTPTPDLPADAQQALTVFWESATKSLFIVDYSFNLPIFETLIPTLLNNNIDVTLVLDKSQSSGSTEKPIINNLQTLDAQYKNFRMIIGTSSMHQIIHDKFSVVDGIHAEYGSFNFTQAAGKEDNFFFIEQNSPVAENLLQIGETILQWIVDNEPQRMPSLPKDSATK